MNNKIALVASLLVAFAGVAQAQDTTTCTCNTSAARTANAAALATLLGNKMACGNVGSEVWQEWHNGASSGPIVDYKLGPTDTRDPSSTVGTYIVNSNNTVTYNYAGGGGSYTYDVCYVSSSNNYTFCGANYGGRNITGVRVGGSGLQNCQSVSVVAPSISTTRKR
jgi:hypothetical protein